MNAYQKMEMSPVLKYFIKNLNIVQIQALTLTLLESWIIWLMNIYQQWVSYEHNTKASSWLSKWPVAFWMCEDEQKNPLLRLWTHEEWKYTYTHLYMWVFSWPHTFFCFFLVKRLGNICEVTDSVHLCKFTQGGGKKSNIVSIIK